LDIIPLSKSVILNIDLLNENFTKELSMPKMKSVKGAVKRFKVKKNGSIKRGTALTNKTSKI